MAAQCFTCTEIALDEPECCPSCGGRLFVGVEDTEARAVLKRRTMRSVTPRAVIRTKGLLEAHGEGRSPNGTAAVALLEDPAIEEGSSEPTGDLSESIERPSPAGRAPTAPVAPTSLSERTPVFPDPIWDTDDELGEPFEESPFPEVPYAASPFAWGWGGHHHRRQRRVVALHQLPEPPEPAGVEDTPTPRALAPRRETDVQALRDALLAPLPSSQPEQEPAIPVRGVRRLALGDIASRIAEVLTRPITLPLVRPAEQPDPHAPDDEALVEDPVDLVREIAEIYEATFVDDDVERAGDSAATSLRRPTSSPARRPATPGTQRQLSRATTPTLRGASGGSPLEVFGDLRVQLCGVAILIAVLVAVLGGATHHPSPTAGVAVAGGNTPPPPASQTPPVDPSTLGGLPLVRPTPVPGSLFHFSAFGNGITAIMDVATPFTMTWSTSCRATTANQSVQLTVLPSTTTAQGAAVADSAIPQTPGPNTTTVSTPAGRERFGSTAKLVPGSYFLVAHASGDCLWSIQGDGTASASSGFGAGPAQGAPSSTSSTASAGGSPTSGASSTGGSGSGQGTAIPAPTAPAADTTAPSGTSPAPSAGSAAAATADPGSQGSSAVTSSVNGPE